MPRARLPSLPLLLPLLLLMVLTGCATVTPVVGAELVGAVTVGSVAAIGRTPVDAAYSLVTGKDCSRCTWIRARPIVVGPSRSLMRRRTAPAASAWWIAGKTPLRCQTWGPAWRTARTA